MTATTSTTKKSFFGTRYKMGIVENKKLFIVNLVLQAIGVPLMMILALYMAYMDVHERPYPEELESIIPVSFFAVIISLLSGLICARAPFKYLHSKSMTDMHYSLPLTSTQRFLADYLSGLTIYVVPALVSAILTIIILLIGNNFVPMENFWKEFPFFALLALTILIAMLMYYSLTVIVSVCCGGTFEAFFSIFAANILIPATVACSYVVIMEAAPYGADESNLMTNFLFTSTSPVGTVIFFIDYLIEASIEDLNGALYAKWTFSSILVIAAYTVGALLLYKHRKAESVSKPYVYKMLNHIIMLLGIYCILSLFITSESGMIAGIIICGIIYFILEVITKKGFKGMGMSVLRFAGMITAVFLICGICESTEGFGIAGYVPTVKNVKSVQIDMYGYSSGNLDSVSSENAELIKAVVEAHEKLVDIHYSSEGYPEYTEEEPARGTFVIEDRIELYIGYSLKSGRIVRRRYNVPSLYVADIFEKLQLSAEYAEKQKHVLMSYADEDNYFKLTFYDEFSMYSPSNSAYLTKSETKKLADAYRNDLLAMTEEDYNSSPLCGYLISEQFPVRECFTATLEFLEDYDITPTKINTEWLDGYVTMGEPIEIGVYDNVCSGTHINNYVGNWEYDYIYIYSDKVFTSNPISNGYYYDDTSAYVNTPEEIELLGEIIEQGRKPVIDKKEVSGAVVINMGQSDAVYFLEKSEENDALIKEAIKIFGRVPVYN